jgi:tripartite ATP-independent transporter DctP family solute receptor
MSSSAMGLWLMKADSCRSLLCVVLRDRFRGGLAVAALVWGCFLAAGCAGDSTGPLELKLGHVAAPGSLVSDTAEDFARRVNQRLGGRARVSVFGSSQLGGDETLMVKLKLGTVDFSFPSTVMSSMIEAFGLFEMPYLIKDREHMLRVEEKIFWPYLAPEAEQRGFKVLSVWENGFRHITNNTRPIVEPADLRGIKLRTPRGVWRVRLFQSFGANPTPMPLEEVFVALQTGVLDGQENPLSQIHTQRFEEVQHYLSLSRHVYSPAYLMTGKETWERMPDDIRKEIAAAAGETKQYVLRRAAELDDELLETMKQSNIEVNEVDRASFVKASEAIYKEFGRSIPGGRQWIDEALALAGP